MLTWNVENYLAEDRLVDGTFRKDYPKTEAAKAALRATVRALSPDVLALQEMGPLPYLEELQRDLATEGAVYPHRALLDGPDAERHLAVLARVPLRRVEHHAALSYRLNGTAALVRRGVLEVAVALGEGEISLFVVHLKSRHSENRADPESSAQREGEAEAVRDLLLRRFPDPATARYLVAGDCNDRPRSRTLQALARRGQTTIAVALPAADPRGDAWTHHFRRAEEFSRSDYILVSPGLLPSVVDARAEIPDTPAIRAASDHRPVLVRLRARPADRSERKRPDPGGVRPREEGRPLNARSP